MCNEQHPAAAIHKLAVNTKEHPVEVATVEVATVAVATVAANDAESVSKAWQTFFFLRPHDENRNATELGARQKVSVHQKVG